MVFGDTKELMSKDKSLRFSCIRSPLRKRPSRGIVRHKDFMKYYLYLLMLVLPYFMLSACSDDVTEDVPVVVNHADLTSDGELFDGILHYKITSNASQSREVKVIGCEKEAVKVQIPTFIEYNGAKYSVTSIGEDAFYKCSGLTSVTIGNSVTSIGEYAFHGCHGLTSVTIGNSVTSIGDGAFRGCSGLTSINVQKGNAKYDSRENCNAIIETASNTLITGCKNTIIPNSVTSIGDFAFEGCSGLTSVTIGNSVTSIGDGAFSDCSGLTSITIPNSVTSIGNYAFYGCSGLTSVTIGNSVTSIGDEAFKYCENINTITSLAILPPVCGKGVFISELFNKTQVYVPNTGNALARYLGNNVWGQFRYIFEKDLTGVETPVMNNESQVSNLINLNGQYISDAQRGINL